MTSYVNVPELIYDSTTDGATKTAEPGTVIDDLDPALAAALLLDGVIRVAVANEIVNAPIGTEEAARLQGELDAKLQAEAEAKAKAEAVAPKPAKAKPAARASTDDDLV